MFSKKLKALRQERHCTQEALANALGVAKSTISMYESGKREPDFETLEAIADYFNVNMSSLVDKKVSFKSPELTDDVVVFPVIGELAAGYEHIALEDWSGDTIEIPSRYLRGRKKEDFIVLKVKGDSMYPMYQNGDVVLVLKQDTMNHSGEIGAVIYEDENATLKKIEYVEGEDWMRLVPLNPEYMPKTIEGEALDHCRIIGIPKLLIREF